MPSSEQLRVQYDCISKTVLLQCKERSHVLSERFENKDSAERAAQKYAETHWGYRAPVTTQQ